MTDDPYDLEFESDKCNTLLKLLNETTTQPNASLKFEMLCGAYKFSDEFPKISADDELLFSLVTLLRMLWAFRISLVRGNPRAEFARWWNLAKATAPNWAGFTEDRWSTAAIPYAAECSLRCRKFDSDLDAFEQNLENQS